MEENANLAGIFFVQCEKRVPMVCEAIKSCLNDMLQLHNIYYEVNPLRIDVAALYFRIQQQKPMVEMSDHTAVKKCQ